MSINVEHPCIYLGVSVESHDDDYSWADRWVYWYDRFGRVEKARMKRDVQDHFYPNTKMIREEDIIGWSESLPDMKDKTLNEQRQALGLEPVGGLSDRCRFKYCPNCGNKIK